MAEITTDEPVAIWSDGTDLDLSRVYPLVVKLRRQERQLVKENRALRAALRIKENHEYID
jgi:hypothetical protein